MGFHTELIYETVSRTFAENGFRFIVFSFLEGVHELPSVTLKQTCPTHFCPRSPNHFRD